MSSIILQPKVAVSIVPATAAGTLKVRVGSELNHEYDIAVTNTESATLIGDAIVAAVNADLDCPVTASNSIGTVTFTADNKGTVGNTIGREVVGSVAGAGTRGRGRARRADGAD